MKFTKKNPDNKELPRSFQRELLVTAQSDPDDPDMVICAGCGFGFSETGLTLDHRDPKSAGGSNELTNLVLLCFDCNQTKGNRLTLIGLRDRIRKERVNAISDNEVRTLEDLAILADKHAKSAGTRAAEKELARSLHNKFEPIEEMNLESLEIPLPDEPGSDYKRAVVITIGHEATLPSTPNSEISNDINEGQESASDSRRTYRQMQSRGYSVPGEPILRSMGNEPGPLAIRDHPLCPQLHQKVDLGTLPLEWVPCDENGSLSHVNDRRPLPIEFVSASHFVPDKVYGHIDDAKRYISVPDLELAHSRSWTRNMGLFLCNDMLLTTSVEAFGDFLNYVPSVLYRFVYPYWWCNMFALSAKTFAGGCGEINTVARVLDRHTTDELTPHFYNAVILWDPAEERAVECLWEPQTGKWIEKPTDLTLYTGRGKIDWC